MPSSHSRHGTRSEEAQHELLQPRSGRRIGLLLTSILQRVVVASSEHALRQPSLSADWRSVHDGHCRRWQSVKGRKGEAERGDEEAEDNMCGDGGRSVGSWMGPGWTALSGAFSAERCTAKLGSGCVVLWVSFCEPGREARRSRKDEVEEEGEEPTDVGREAAC